MKNMIILILTCITFQLNAQKPNHMKVNCGILTEKISESKAFYMENLDFEVVFENDFYLLMKAPGEDVTISFLLPNHPTQQPFFHKPFTGQGMYLTIEMEDVDTLYEKIKALGTKIEIDIRDEPWGDRHFAIQDPNGIGIDLVKYTSPE